MHLPAIRLPFLSTLALSLALLSGCGSTARFAGDTQTTIVSGSTNTTNTPQIISVEGGAYGVTALEWAEGGTSGGLNKPCYLNVEFRNLSDALRTSGNDIVSREVNVCDNQNYNEGSLLRPRGGGGPYNPRLPLFVDGIESCDSKTDNNERIKGITYWRTLINDADPDPSEFECSIGTPIQPDVISEPCDVMYGDDATEHVKQRAERRPNCGEWNGPATCDPGKIASGVRVFTSVAGEIIGLGLVCETVEFEQQ